MKAPSEIPDGATALLFLVPSTHWDVVLHGWGDCHGRAGKDGTVPVVVFAHRKSIPTQKTARGLFLDVHQHPSRGYEIVERDGVSVDVPCPSACRVSKVFLKVLLLRVGEAQEI